MAAPNTETIPTSHTNGVIEDGYDEDDKSKLRPADIDADMREMERRKRVELIMNSRLFREELERIIESQMKDGNNSAGLLQQIYEMVGSKYGTNNHGPRNSSCVAPINDIRGVEAMGYAKGEKILRCKLSALFRLIDLYGWSQNIYNHVTARLSQQEEHFLVNPYGLLYNEITASSLVKVDMQGTIIEPGTTNFSVNAGGFQLHAAIYAARPDLKCIVHLHTPSVLAVSSLKDGLLPLCQEAAVIGDISQHPYVGTPNEPEERDKLVRSLGPNNKVIFLTNHGALCCGTTIEETFFYVYNTVSACETQLKVMPFGKDNLILLSDETRKIMYDAARKVPENIVSPNQNLPAAAAEKRWRVGGLEFEALMRMLDNAGFRTGYVYRQPLIKGEVPRPRNDVEVPPAVSSLGYLLEEEELYKQGVWKKQFGAKGSDRIRWLNSPNVYQKVEILETGTTDPKKITKWVDANNEEWVTDGSPSHTSTPVKIENALQFVPKNTNPKEFKKLQKQIKENRRADVITSGPQSHIFEGVSWEEAKKLQDANLTGASDQVILVGAASKGIIQREFQHNATVYKTPYAKNPFDAVTDEEIEKYKKDINRKQKGDSYYDEDESDALSSSLPPSGKNITGVTSETEDDSLAHEMRVIHIQTSTAPKASQAEVVLSDDGKKSKNRFVHSLGSMLTLRREYDRRRETEPSLLFTRTWELRKLFAVRLTVIAIRAATYPAACPQPTRVRIGVSLRQEGDDGGEDCDGCGRLGETAEPDLLVRLDVAYAKRMCKMISDEIRQRLKNGELLRRPALAARPPAATTFSSRDVVGLSARLLLDWQRYSKPAPTSIDSSEMEYTTLIEVPPGERKYSSESLHDFSSTTNTDEDEDDDAAGGAASDGESRQPRLNRASSLSSLASCVGVEYEEAAAPPPPLEMLTLAEVTELTASFTTASDDTSVDDVTVIYRPHAAAASSVRQPPADESGDEAADGDDAQSHISDGSKSDGSFSISSIDDDGDGDDDDQQCISNTYTRMVDVDFEDSLQDAVGAAEPVLPPPPEECSTAFVGKESKFQMQLSVIYEEQGNTLAEEAPPDPAAGAHLPGVANSSSNDEKAVVADSCAFDRDDVRPSLGLAASIESTDSCAYVKNECDRFSAAFDASAESSRDLPSIFAEPLISVEPDIGSSICRDQPVSDRLMPSCATVDDDSAATVATTANINSASYCVSDAVNKLNLLSTYVLNLVSGIEDYSAPGNSGSCVDIKPISDAVTTDSCSSAACVQHNSNSEAQTISDTSLVSCIADSSENVAVAKVIPPFQHCSEVYVVDSGILIEDSETVTCCSEIFEEEASGAENVKDDPVAATATDDLDNAREIGRPATIPAVCVDTFYRTVFDVPSLEISSSNGSVEQLHGGCSSLADSESSAIYSDNPSCGVVDRDTVGDYQIPTDLPNSEMRPKDSKLDVIPESQTNIESPDSQTKATNCEDPLVEKIVFAGVADDQIDDEASSNRSNAEDSDSDDVEDLNIAILQTTSLGNVSRDDCHRDIRPENNLVDDDEELETGCNAETRSVDERNDTPTHASGDTSDGGLENSDDFESADDRISPHFVTIDSAHADEEDSGAVVESCDRFVTAEEEVNDVSQSQTSDDDGAGDTFSGTGNVADAMVAEEDADSLPDGSDHSKTDASVASFDDSAALESEFPQPPADESQVALTHEEFIAEEAAGIESNTVLVRALQANADVVCLSFDKFNCTEMLLNTNICSSTDEENVMDESAIPSGHVAANSATRCEQLDTTQSLYENVAWLLDTDVSAANSSKIVDDEEEQLIEFNVTEEDYEVIQKDDDINDTRDLNPNPESMVAQVPDVNAGVTANFEDAYDDYDDTQHFNAVIDSTDMGGNYYPENPEDCIARVENDDNADVAPTFRIRDADDDIGTIGGRNSRISDSLISVLSDDESLNDCFTRLFFDADELNRPSSRSAKVQDRKIEDFASTEAARSCHIFESSCDDAASAADDDSISSPVAKNVLPEDDCRSSPSRTCAETALPGPPNSNCCADTQRHSEATAKYDENGNRIDEKQWLHFVSGGATAYQMADDDGAAASPSAATAPKSGDHTRPPHRGGGQQRGRGTSESRYTTTGQRGESTSASWCQSGGDPSMGELSLKLRLKVEWGGETNERSSSSSSGRDEKRPSPFDDDSLEGSSSGGDGGRGGGGARSADAADNGGCGGGAAAHSPPAAAHRRSPQSELLFEFKQNYPKFIQYSYFSPKVRVRRAPKRVPRTVPAARARRRGGCRYGDDDVAAAATAAPTSEAATSCGSVADVVRRGSTTSQQSAGECRWRYAATEESATSAPPLEGDYFRFSNVSTDWSLTDGWTPLRRRQCCSRVWQTMLANRPLHLAAAESPLSADASFKTSTPKGAECGGGPVAQCVATPPSPIISSLEEFEILESLLEADRESVVTR